MPSVLLWIKFQKVSGGKSKNQRQPLTLTLALALDLDLALTLTLLLFSLRAPLLSPSSIRHLFVVPP